MNLSPISQYLLLALAGVAATLVFLTLYNRREKRRKHAIELASLMDRWGLEWFAELYRMYAVGDYSGLAHKLKEVVQTMRTDEAMVAKLGDVAMKVATYYAKHNRAKADELRDVLGDPLKGMIAAGTVGSTRD